jgi:non-specific serine/threonine protein kinase
MNLDNLGCVARRQGDYAAARVLHEQSLSLSRELSDRAAIAQSLANLGHVARAIGDMPTAHQRYTESLLIRRQIGDRHGIAMTSGNLGVLAARAADPDLARTLLNESLGVARTVDDKRIWGAALHQLAALDAAQGELRAALAGYAESLRVLDQVQDVWGIARALHGSADVLRSAGRAESARQLRTIADGLLDSIEALRSPADPSPDKGASDMVGRALALLAAEPAMHCDEAEEADRDRLPLTRREREIAALIARGLTNRQIAAELVIAERTADTHVSNLLGKLGARTRSQIAAWAVEHDLRPN